MGLSCGKQGEYFNPLKRHIQTQSRFGAETILNQRRGILSRVQKNRLAIAVRLVD